MDKLKEWASGWQNVVWGEHVSGSIATTPYFHLATLRVGSGPLYAYLDHDGNIHFQRTGSVLRGLEPESWRVDSPDSPDEQYEWQGAYKVDYYQDLLVVMDE